MFLLLCSSRTICPLNHLWRNMIVLDMSDEVEYRCFIGGLSWSTSDRALKDAFQSLVIFFMQRGHKEWINEVNFLGVVNHPNLVKLVGYCAEDDERGIQRLLVYELMSNKSLEDHLLGRANRLFLG
ncbi:putative protein kinase RLK-Pelle-RLCK-VIIa-2 family [Helianthus annuus]|nr:putative protein kinase RLK-Pelle-RLCK-VIIa-2 family [Helianthus annuus]